MQPIPVRQWGWPIPENEHILIAGPCSAETAEQTLDSCKGAAERGAHILRAGIWKPRTRPEAFAGIGEAGLPWIVEAGKVTGKPVAIEVASARHVELALQAGVDILWIGARSTANPFTVQELADALRGVDVPVFVKNPVNPDLDLWIGALERISMAGISRLGAIFRGFSVYKPGIYRNAPMWELPIELRRQFPTLDIIVDPSHITGNRSLIGYVAQHAIDLDFNGLMIETHIDPDHAWSDAAQQLTPDQLGSALNSLVHRRTSVDDPEFLANLEALRYDIDNLDQEIIRSLGQRMEVSREIGHFKRENEVTILQMNRWSNIFESRVQTALQAGLSETFARDLIQAIHNESIRQQGGVMNHETVAVSKANSSETGPILHRS
ncbi:MAG: bifunctional 3-deoxy-7-phosphoheptulonate synthase/chorismate mutase type II [Saprospiraceae bacterium]|nr:bifunctional 3-deoxy-7-phosphoheptulonate synthase/chorismate mutase type II [Saprospiraceae bacterium]